MRSRTATAAVPVPVSLSLRISLSLLFKQKLVRVSLCLLGRSFMSLLEIKEKEYGGKRRVLGRACGFKVFETV